MTQVWWDKLNKFMISCRTYLVKISTRNDSPIKFNKNTFNTLISLIFSAKKLEFMMLLYYNIKSPVIAGMQAYMLLCTEVFRNRA